MFFTLEQEHEGSNCPRCGLTDTFLSTFSSARYCVNCHQLYDRTDGTRLRKQLKTCLDYRDLSLPEFELIFREYQGCSGETAEREGGSPLKKKNTSNNLQGYRGNLQ